MYRPTILFALMISAMMAGVGNTEDIGEFEAGQIQNTVGLGIPKIWPDEGDIAELAEEQIAQHEEIINYLNHLRNEYLQGSQTKRSGFFNRRSGSPMYDVPSQDWNKRGDFTSAKRSGFFNRKRSGYEQRK
ncbi:uncharacterized protein LOC117124352 [Anneissia japonica]|uniref:uncharacterized protein LOC117124352 n=1 Tax=Anneissia japonica TaxID=1529436 RepID=UPI0014254C83|nr:uncharacterized protein LOC117124352 [Anneissia japonica]